MLPTHGDQKYQASSLLEGAYDWSALRVERRRINAGSYNAVRPDCTELVHILSGKAVVRRRADGPIQQGLALPGSSWLVPAGTDEKLLELDGDTECLMVYLPAGLLEDSAVQDYGVNPGRADLVYEGGFIDPTLAHLSLAMRGLLDRPRQAIDRLFVQGIRTAVSAHLVSNYNRDRWQPPSRQPALETKRLRRVLDYIEAHLDKNMSLDALAGEACLSPYHFSRLFREATGLAPHRYVTERRIQTARQLITTGRMSLAEIALDTGFGSQANFSRVFRKGTGLTPKEYRDTQRVRPVVASKAMDRKFGQ